MNENKALITQPMPIALWLFVELEYGMWVFIELIWLVYIIVYIMIVYWTYMTCIYYCLHHVHVTHNNITIKWIYQ